ncbi:hypothetical protein QBC46DRAFT_388056 [Diplogelasinospora grovesii]|uniref:Uncharacterized protein n=1 Tax=Diplogelasinospora grovesii TaxID=303347 RepID=A0AAN6S3R7_9PEZI|nr:hypothetical protein QBC46DRAFT_388056 [Diplogelasinospora grovesii]
MDRDAPTLMAADSDLPGILRLTPETRRRIYLYAGVGHRQHYSETAPAVYDLGDPSSFEAVKTQYEIDQGFQSFHGLLLSCRTIYAEASALLYSANWFIIRYQPRRSLEPLRALTPRALASLTNLKVVLNQTSCHEQKTGSEGSGGCCNRLWTYERDPSGSGGRKLVSGCVVWHEYDHDLPLDGSGSLAESVLVEWHATAAYLASHIVPGKLELTLVCDVHHEDVETAKLVLDDLRLLPRLKDCHVRLCETRDSRLQQLAQEAALRARGIVSSEPPTSSGSFSPRLVNLARELRLRILEYTDLVTPCKEVMWSRASRGYRIERGPCSALEGNGYCKRESHHGCQFNQCWRMPWPQPSVGCFCRRRHTAFSSRCKCWAPPTPLFLVCRTLYSEANLVFYGENRFIIVDGPYSSPFTPWRPGDYPHESFAASQFLRHVVPRHCLGHIRFLELVFAPFTHLSRPRDEHRALQDWSETLDWVKDKLNLPALTLRLIMAGNGEFRPEGSEEMTRAQGKEVLATYNRILSPLRRLDPTSDGGLARFHAELAWPLQWTRWVARKLQEEHAWDWLESKDRELKRRAEHFVMGERYERVSVAAGEPQRSVWTWSYLC